MIDGVKIKQLTVHQDIPDTPDELNGARGVLMEVVRDDDGLMKKFGQTTFTITHRGTIKGFHWHQKQDDVWFVATGRAKVVLHDLRESSPTKGETQTLYAGTGDYKVILIPAGVVHGYKVVSDEPVLMFYHTTMSYDPKDPDEQRIAYDDPTIAFNWNED